MVGSLRTEPGSKTMTLDVSTHKLYVPRPGPLEHQGMPRPGSSSSNTTSSGAPMRSTFLLLALMGLCTPSAVAEEPAKVAALAVEQAGGEDRI